METVQLGSEYSLSAELLGLHYRLSAAMAQLRGEGPGLSAVLLLFGHESIRFWRLERRDFLSLQLKCQRLLFFS